MWRQARQRPAARPGSARSRPSRAAAWCRSASAANTSPRRPWWPRPTRRCVVAACWPCSYLSSWLSSSRLHLRRRPCRLRRLEMCAGYVARSHRGAAPTLRRVTRTATRGPRLQSRCCLASTTASSACQRRRRRTKRIRMLDGESVGERSALHRDSRQTAVNQPIHPLRLLSAVSVRFPRVHSPPGLPEEGHCSSAQFPDSGSGYALTRKSALHKQQPNDAARTAENASRSNRILNAWTSDVLQSDIYCYTEDTHASST